MALASVVHLAAIGALQIWALHRAPPIRPALSAEATVDAPEQQFELELTESNAPPASVSDDAREPALTRSAQTVLGASSRSSAGEQRARSLAPGSVEDAPPSAPVAAVELSTDTGPASAQDPPATKIDLGLQSNAWQRWLGDSKREGSSPDSPANSARRRALFHTPPKSTTGGLQEGLEAQDRARGLGPSGQVVTALYHAAHASMAPEVGRARFQVTVLDTGTVEIQVDEASDHFDGWRAVAAEAAEALRHARPRIPEARAGVKLVVELTAEEILPGGTKTNQLHGPRPEVEPPRFRSTQDAQAELKDRNPVAGENGQLAAGTKANVNLPGVYVAQRGKVCGYRLGWSLLGPVLDGGCDLSNIGARPQRMVRTHVLVETMF
ncbi:MAG TPA: hypothetical protein VFK05_21365 [Polyangiaceae bacterium]|nr:hypothetical protein [Polyangiaceae bacterium]